MELIFSQTMIEKIAASLVMEKIALNAAAKRKAAKSLGLIFNLGKKSYSCMFVGESVPSKS